ncbi:NAD-dependent isocitrate dehydrogenase, partial [Coemansia sp. RSA 2611]
DKANPTALLLSSCMMLRHMQLGAFADRIEAAALGTIGEGAVITADLGGRASNTQFTDAIISKL